MLAAAALVAASCAAQTIQINRDNKTIAISATDEATATADIAAITVGFEVFAPDAQAAYAEGARRSHAILEALHNAGVKDEAIESEKQNIQRNEEPIPGAPPVQEKQQYVLSQSWIVSVPPSHAAEILGTAVVAGANKSGDIDWRLINRKALQAKAAEAALVKAREIATNMAEGLHVKLGALIYASNQTPRTALYGNDPNQSAGTVAVMVESRMPPPPPPPVIEIRKQAIREEAIVYAVFAIE
jgi:uncharacterized protein YggE